MTSSSLPPETGDDLPIDAEFEPAEIKPDQEKPQGRGPGWAAFGGVGVLALAGFALAAASSGLIPGFQPGASKVAALETRLDAFTTTQVSAAERAVSQDAEIAALKGRADSLRADRTRTVTDIRAIRDEISSVQEDIEILKRARVASLAEAAETAESDPAGVDTSALEARITALETAVVAQSDGYTLAIELLESRLDTLEEKAGTESLTATAATNNRTEAALALSAIEAAARRGRPFLSAYQRLNTAIPDNGAVRSLSSVASKAVPTRADLTATLPALIDAALDQEARTSRGGSGWMRDLFGDGIQVRRKDAVTTRDYLDLATAALDAGELAETIEYIRAIDADLQPVFTDWLLNAEDRHLLEETLEALRLTMIAEERP
ncbi:MAG: hypothetical protein NXH88_04025 [Hyphomonas sp.]|nr:hypothetical protein [Hyphomonas sp.]